MRLMLAALAALMFSTAAFAQAPPVSPINQCFRTADVTPSDSADLPRGVVLGLFNGNATACNITMTLTNDSASHLWSNAQSGSLLPVRAKRVFATGTNCTGILACYQQ